MVRASWVAVSAALVGLALPAPAVAQTRPAPAAQPRPAPARPRTPVTGRVHLAVNGLFQITSNDFTDTWMFSQAGETGRVEAAYSVGSGLAIDASGVVVVAPRLAVGAGVTRYSTGAPIAIEASVPHPFFFNQPRDVAGEVDGEREDLAVHIQVRGLFPVTPRLQVAVFGGPSFFRVTQAVVEEVAYAESYPYDTAAFSRATTVSETASAFGFHAGADVAYFFSRSVGVGGMVQFARGTVQMPLPSGDADIQAGGLQAGGGLRLRF